MWGEDPEDSTNASNPQPTHTVINTKLKETIINPDSNDLTNDYWNELGDTESDPKTREFANNLVTGALANKLVIDDRIRTRAEHWRIERMAIVDRNVLRLAVYEFLFEDTPHTVVINEALEIARRFSTFEATQFINGILDAIKLDLEKEPGEPESKKKSKSSAN